MERSNAEYFWQKLKKTENGCMIWTGSVLRTGYGQVKWQGKGYLAHRLAAYLAGILPTLEKGKPGPGLTLVCHSCDVRLCCNPEHLWLGSAKENIQDAAAKGRMRGRPGEEHHNAKLKLEDVAEIRWLAKEGAAHKDLSAMFGVTRRHIHRIANDCQWQERTKL